MATMDQEKTKRVQHLKIIASEIVMVIAIIFTVLILVLIVSGYWLGADFKVERQGLLQVSSIPTGADVYIDGDSAWFQRTNTSKTLSSGEHSVTLSKDGYDTWSKKITVREGLLYRLHYPRLFLNEREVEAVSEVDSASFATISPDRNILLLANSTLEWEILPLNNEKIKSRKIDVSKVFENMNSDNDDSVAWQILSADWAKDNAHVLFKIKNLEKIEWVILDIDNVKDSINLSKKFDMVFDDVKIMNNSANILIGLQGQSLRKIDISSEQVSAILAEGVMPLDHFENEVIFVAERKNDEAETSEELKENDDSEANEHAMNGEGERGIQSQKRYALYLLDMGNGKIKELESLDNPAKVTLSKFYDDRYITTVWENDVALYSENDFVKMNEFALGFNPINVKVGHNGEFIVLTNGSKIATLDMEALAVKEWDTESLDFGWIDDDMIYSITSGNLLVYDFDGLNKRELAKNVTGGFPITITENKWMYYLRDGKLIREWLIKK